MQGRNKREDQKVSVLLFLIKLFPQQDSLLQFTLFIFNSLILVTFPLTFYYGFMPSLDSGLHLI